MLHARTLVLPTTHSHHPNRAAKIALPGGTRRLAHRGRHPQAAGIAPQADIAPAPVAPALARAIAARAARHRLAAPLHARAHLVTVAEDHHAVAKQVTLVTAAAIQSATRMRAATTRGTVRHARVASTGPALVASGVKPAATSPRAPTDPRAAQHVLHKNIARPQVPRTAQVARVDDPVTLDQAGSHLGQHSAIILLVALGTIRAPTTAILAQPAAISLQAGTQATAAQRALQADTARAPVAPAPARAQHALQADTALAPAAPAQARAQAARVAGHRLAAPPFVLLHAHRGMGAQDHHAAAKQVILRTVTAIVLATLRHATTTVGTAPNAQVASTGPAEIAYHAPPAATSRRARISTRAARRAPQADTAQARVARAPALAQHALQADTAQARVAPALVLAQHALQADTAQARVARAPALAQHVLQKNIARPQVPRTAQVARVDDPVTLDQAGSHLGQHSAMILLVALGTIRAPTTAILAQPAAISLQAGTQATAAQRALQADTARAPVAPAPARAQAARAAGHLLAAPPRVLRPPAQRRAAAVSTCSAAAAPRAPPAATNRRARIPTRAARRAPQADTAQARVAQAPALAQHALQADTAQARVAPAPARAQAARVGGRHLAAPPRVLRPPARAQAPHPHRVRRHFVDVAKASTCPVAAAPRAPPAATSLQAGTQATAAQRALQADTARAPVAPAPARAQAARAAGHRLAAPPRVLRPPAQRRAAAASTCPVAAAPRAPPAATRARVRIYPRAAQRALQADIARAQAARPLTAVPHAPVTRTPHPAAQTVRTTAWIPKRHPERRRRRSRLLQLQRRMPSR
jgi:hypothetical protein